MSLKVSLTFVLVLKGLVYETRYHTVLDIMQIFLLVLKADIIL